MFFYFEKQIEALLFDQGFDSQGDGDIGEALGDGFFSVMDYFDHAIGSRAASSQFFA